MKERDYKENKIYAAIIGHCEGMERAGKYEGNGHHLAQRLLPMIVAGLLPEKQKEIYDVLTTSPMRTSEIAEKVGMSTGIVSAQLCKILDTSQLVGRKRSGRKCLWYRSYSV